jgi:hypothetical protein
MARYRTHSIVRDTRWQCAADPCGVGEKRIETAIATLQIC